MPIQTITITLDVEYEYQEDQRGGLYTEPLAEGVIVLNESEILDNITDFIAEKLKD